MSKESSDREFQRARSADQKEERREDILRAARSHLAEVGFDAFSMGPLAKAAGVARATLYLYFPTREEVLLALYLEEAQAWVDTIVARTGPGIEAEAFLTAFYETSIGLPRFLELAPRLLTTIESNVSAGSIIRAKRQTRDMTSRVGHHASEIFALPPEEGVRVFTALMGLLLGFRQMMRRPAFDVDQLPDDVLEVIDGTDEQQSFMYAGRWILQAAGV